MRKSLIVAAVLGIAASGAFAQRAGADYDDWRPAAGVTSAASRAEVQAQLSREQLSNPNLNESALWNPQATAAALPVSRAAVRDEVRQALARGEVLPVERNASHQFTHPAQRGVSSTRFAGR
ncbi:hypothetical protein [Aquabacterium sp. J223]|uniref:hypothetical protein n=1 Tax=Aquabacterium sp. J223 TaxID=2898431 RepID=UPI0021AD85B7|nr:hypothetical protein [Aquabacterium sp. J223]UUX96169.1 hypothetical protein LRS07_02210 [Aquabacterium sp. J223]